MKINIELQEIGWKHFDNTEILEAWKATNNVLLGSYTIDVQASWYENETNSIFKFRKERLSIANAII